MAERSFGRSFWGNDNKEQSLFQRAFKSAIAMGSVGGDYGTSHAIYENVDAWTVSADKAENVTVYQARC
jgi:hypothetical protein